MDPDPSIPSFPPERDTSRFQPPGDEHRGSPGDAPVASPDEGPWVLESCVDDEGSLQRTPVQPLPFRIGRSADVQLVLSSNLVSKHHAEICSDGKALRVRDLESRNGTFVNRQRVAQAILHEGDILHFGDFEFRLARDQDVDLPDAEGTLLLTEPLSQHFQAAQTLIPRLIEQGAVTMFFQPIVTLPAGRVIAYEALGRGRYEGLPENPMELFDLAGKLGPEVQVELSQLFRRKAVELVRDRPDPPTLFLNTHWVEFETTDLRTSPLVQSLKELRDFAPLVDVVLEVHESALDRNDYKFSAEVRDRLLEINVALAYDDFGTGRSHLIELADSTPNYVKFDRSFVKELHRASTSRQRLVSGLVALARELRIKTVAEGIEDAQEAEACMRAGFDWAQGYHFGRPGPVESIP